MSKTQIFILKKYSALLLVQFVRNNFKNSGTIIDQWFENPQRSSSSYFSTKSLKHGGLSTMDLVLKCYFETLSISKKKSGGKVSMRDKKTGQKDSLYHCEKSEHVF